MPAKHKQIEHKPSGRRLPSKGNSVEKKEKKGEKEKTDEWLTTFT